MKIRNPTKEWNIPVPWGQIALASWGDESLPPILLVHGRQDSLATFIPLLAHLPDKYYYVGLDLPGHGRSSHFPPGVMLSRLHMLPAIRCVVTHLGWERFVYMGHSLGTELGKYYNAVYPGQIWKVIDLDPGPSMYRIQMKRLPEWYDYFYEQYYSNFERYNSGGWVYSREEASRAVERARGLTEEQAALVLSRNLVPAGDKYTLAWDPRLKRLATLNTPPAYYLALAAQAPTPTLVVWATDSMVGFMDGVDATRKLLLTMQEKLPNFSIVMVPGGHDVHLTHPHRVAPHVVDFLEREFEAVAAKL